MTQSAATLLIVDDDPITLKALISLLEREYRVVVAKSGEQAMKRLTDGATVDLILLDITMPGIDGYETCRRIKSSPSTKNIPVIFLSSRSEVEDETRGFEAGGIDYITKPFNPPIVEARVKTHVELKRRGDLLEQLSAIDGLTQIPNRRRFDEFLQFEWNRSSRDRQPLSLILMDIDFFKLYNDHYGHAAGDECLKRVARTLAGSMNRSVDFVARYGGEEFICLLPETALEGAREVANRMLANIREQRFPHEASQVEDHVTLSLGLATVVPEGETPPVSLIEKADEALYRAKKEGRNRMAEFDAAGEKL